MDVKAILVIGSTETPDGVKDASAESFGGLPLALCDVLGRTVLARTVQRLRHNGISQFKTICDQKAASSLDAKTIADCNVVVEEQGLWRCAEAIFNDYVQQKGAELVLVIRLGAYTELDYEDFIQFHLAQRGRATVVVDSRGFRTGTVALCASRRNDASYLFRHNMEEFRVPCEQYVFRGYLNRLLNPADLRQLSIDSLLQRNQLQPIGTEIRPGVWAGVSARIHPRSRIVAPAYIGERAKIRASAVITRFTSVEHHAVIDCGAVIENSSIQPYTYVGAGLDVNFSIVGRNRIANLRRNVEVGIKDPKLLSTISPSAPVRAMREISALASYLPHQIIRGLLNSSERSMPVDIPAAVNTPSPALQENVLPNPKGSVSSSEYSSDFVVARRYGNE
jgi:NDP-sugar pyrophosphorylase family protein